MNRLIACAIAALLWTIVGFAPAASRAADLDDAVDAAGGSVQGTGTSTIEQPPTLVRMSVTLSGQGKTLKEALAKLKDRGEAALLQVEKLKADKKSIKLSEPGFSPVASAQRAQLEQMMRQQRRARGGRAVKTPELPQSVTVSATLTAEWPLSAKGAEQLLLAAEELKEKIKAADLAGVKEAKQASAEDEELAEETAQMMENYGMDQSQMNPGEPTFMYVAHVAAAVRDKALAEAFAKAKAQAVRVAGAAGAKLGKLERIRGDATPETAGMDENYNPYAYRSAMMMRQAMGVGGSAANEDEAMSPVPGPVKLHFTVNAQFKLE